MPLQKVGRRNDLSYGVYIYAWPVQQLVALSGGSRHGVALYIALSIALTYPLAALSWFLVEKPALRHKRESRRLLPADAPLQSEHA